MAWRLRAWSLSRSRSPSRPRPRGWWSARCRSSPAASRPARNSENDSAPAMQPTNEPRSARSATVRRSSATISVTPIRPPGRSTRAISRKTAGLSAARLITQLLMTTSTDAAGKGIASIVPAEELDVRRAGLGRVALGEREHLVGHIEPDGPSGRADPLGREQDVDPAARAEVEHALAFAKLGDGDRVAAAQATRGRRLPAARIVRGRSRAPRRSCPACRCNSRPARACVAAAA